MIGASKRNLENMDDLDFAIIVLMNRANMLKNPYTPLAEKISQTIKTLEAIREEHRALKAEVLPREQ